MVGVFKFPSHFVFGAAAGVALIMGLTGCVAADRGGPTGHVETSAAELGHAYAIEVCASCHAVEPGQLVSPNVAAPSFEALATRPDMTRPALSALLRSPHRNMPSLIVEPDRIDDLAAYLGVLGNGE